MRHLDLWLNAKFVRRFPRTQEVNAQPVKIRPPIPRREPHGKVVIYSREMIANYLQERMLS